MYVWYNALLQVSRYLPYLRYMPNPCYILAPLSALLSKKDEQYPASQILRVYNKRFVSLRELLLTYYLYELCKNPFNHKPLS